MLAALLCGLGLPTPRAREPLFASTVSAVERESRGKSAAGVSDEGSVTYASEGECI